MTVQSAKKPGKGTTGLHKKNTNRETPAMGVKKTHRNRSIVYLLLVLLLTLFVFYRGIDNGFVNWDDDNYLHNNPQIKELSINSIKTIFKDPYFANYHPLTTLTYAIEYSLYKLTPRPYHVLNIILHLFNTLLVYLLIKRITAKEDISLLTALLFAIHPMHVESVAWISERKDVLYSMFYISALISYVHYLKSGEKLKYLVVAFIFFTASLLSKSAAVTLPLVMMITLYYIKPRAGFKPLLYILPFFILSLIFGIVALQTQEDAIGSVDINSIYNLPNRILVVFYAIYFYVVKFIYPSGLAAMHPFPIEDVTGIPLSFYLSPLLVVLLILLIIFTKGQIKRLLIFGLLFFFSAIVLNIQIIPVGDAIVQERYTYVPYIGLSFITAQLLSEYVPKKYKPASYAALALYVFFLSLTTYRQVGVWRDSEILWTNSIAVNRQCHISYYSRGAARADKGDYKNAMKDFEAALAINPNYAPAYNNRGVIRISGGDVEGALQDYQKAISLQPKYPKAYNNLGHALALSGKTDEALEQINKAITLSPDYVEAYSNRGNVYFFKQQYDSAIVNYRKALSLDPEYIRAYENMASVYFNKGAYNDAIGYYSKVIEKQPENANAFSFRGRSYFLSGDTAQACSDWSKASALGNEKAGLWYEGFCRKK